MNHANAMDTETGQQLQQSTSNDSGNESHGTDEAASQPPSYKESITRKMLHVWKASLAWVGSKSVPLDPRPLANAVSDTFALICAGHLNFYRYIAIICSKELAKLIPCERTESTSSSSPLPRSSLQPSCGLSILETTTS